MSFLTPTMLWGALAAGIPIALHFFYRSRYRTVPWAAMKFLLTSMEQTSRRLKFQELLLLILRCLLLVVLALALARPTAKTSGSAGKGEAIDAVFLMDTSASMAARDGEKTRWERAREAALGILDQLPPYSTVQIVSCSDRATLAGPRVPSNLDQAKQVLDELKPSDLTTDLMPGAAEALKALERGNAPNKEVYVFSDMQKRGFEQQPSGLSENLKKLRERGMVHLVRCGTRTPSNVSIVSLTPQMGLPRAGQRTLFTVMVRNTGKEPVRNVVVSLSVNGKIEKGDIAAGPADGKQETENVVGPGETKPFAVSARLDKAGTNVLTARVENDELDRDNRFDQVIQVFEQLRILVVDGFVDEKNPERSASFFLRFAFNPIPVEVIPANQASAVSLSGKDLCVLSNVSLDPSQNQSGRVSERFLEALANFVREGKSLLIFGGSNVKAESYNRLLLDRYKLLPVKLGAAFKAPEDKPLSFDRNSARGAYDRVREDRNYQSMERVPIMQVLKVDEPKADAAPRAEGEAVEEVQVLLRYNNGMPAIVGRKRATEGDVLLFTSAAHDEDWTLWPLDPSFLATIQMTFRGLLDQQTPLLNRTVGEALTFSPTGKDAGLPFILVKPDGKRERLGVPQLAQGRPLVRTSETSMAGVYRMTPDREIIGEGAAVFAVTPDPRETEDLTALTNAELDDLLGFKAIHVTAGQNAGEWATDERLNREWTMWVLIVLMILVVSETVLAWVCGRAW